MVPSLTGFLPYRDVSTSCTSQSVTRNRQRARYDAIILYVSLKAEGFWHLASRKPTEAPERTLTVREDAEEGCNDARARENQLSPNRSDDL